MHESQARPPRWYSEVTGYQWLVLIIASAGWVFDVYEGQIFNLMRGPMLAELIQAEESPDVAANVSAEDAAAREERRARDVKFWGDMFLSVFLAGGTLGGVLFGSLADRIGRKPTMAITILCYSLFSGLTYFATDLWQVGTLRFLVAVGVGGEWAVAAALVAEVFPAKARAYASGIFHASSVLGTWMAALAGLWVGAQWRYAYLIGVVPALLILWVRSSVQEPESWRQAKREEQRRGSFGELFGDPRWARSAILGMLFASVGLGTFWAVTIEGQDLTKDLLHRSGVESAVAEQNAKFAYGIVQTAGVGAGLLAFGPLAAWLGRKRAFALMHLGALAIVPIVCYLPQSYMHLLCLLPIFGFFTVGIHAGYAIYFPELFPGRLRATGTGVCFNGGRLLAALAMWLSAIVKDLPGVSLQLAVWMLSSLFAVGLVVLIFLPETKGRPLPE